MSKREGLTVAVIGGTSGIGRAVAERYRKTAARVVVVGRGRAPNTGSAGIETIAADLSLSSEQDRVAASLADIQPDRLVFTAGVLTAKPDTTVEGENAAWMVNHVARRRIVDRIADDLPDEAHIGFISAWGSYKVPPKADYEFGAPGRKGIAHVLRTYIPNDALFADLAARRPTFSIVGYDPGPTKGTRLLSRGHTPFPFSLAAPLFPLIARPVDEVAFEFTDLIENAEPGISWRRKGEGLARPPHLRP